MQDAEPFDLLRRFEHLVLAVSGGSDSTALMILAAKWAAGEQHPPKFTVVTVDHGLRREAAREADKVCAWARKLGFDHVTLRWDGDENLKPAFNRRRARRVTGS